MDGGQRHETVIPVKTGIRRPCLDKVRTKRIECQDPCLRRDDADEVFYLYDTDSATGDVTKLSSYTSFVLGKSFL